MVTIAVERIEVLKDNDMIQDKVIIITGASSGIGEAAAKLLASRGGKVVLGARRENKFKQIADASCTGSRA